MTVGYLLAPARAGARSWRRLSLADRAAVAFLVALPVLLYVPFTLAGRPLMPGDGLYQNYPLRVLTGEVIRSGRLPAWDPLIWSGTPLLAGWNAGSMFPGTWLFAILPGLAAWTLNMLVAPVFGALGIYVLLRQLACRPMAALLAGLVFAYTGFSSGQIVHIGLLQGTAFIPWMLVGIEGVARAEDGRRRICSALLIGVAFALVVLAGDPRSITTAVVAAGVLALARCLRPVRDALRLLALVLSGGVLGVALSAIQWVPGLGFLHASQRGVTAYSFFSAGSLHLGELTSFLLLPDLLGGNGNFNQPVFEGNYNLPELTVGVGFVALVAALAYLPVLGGSLVDRLRRRPVVPASRPIGVWFALVVLGVLLTLGTTTPLGHLLVHVPLFGGERLQNRNALLIDLGLAVLVGCFVDDLLAPPGAKPPARRVLASRSSRAFALLPALATVALVADAYIAPRDLQRRLVATAASTDLFVKMAGYLIASCVLVVLVAVFALLAWRLPLRARRAVLAALCLADVSMYLAFASWLNVPSSRLAPNTLSARVNALVGTNGRFAVYNPNFASPGPDHSAGPRVGVTDLNVLHHTASVQGYGSIVDGTYQSVTATHAFESLDISRLDGESFNTLDLRALLTLPAYLANPLPVGANVPLAGTRAAPRPSGGPWPVSAHHDAEFLLPGAVRLAGLTVVFEGGPRKAPSAIRLTTHVTGEPATSVTVPVAAGSARYNPTQLRPVESVTISDADTRHSMIGAVVADTSAPAGRLLLDGVLQGKLRTPHWRPSAPIGGFLVYLNTDTRGLAWLQPMHDTTPNTDHRAPGRVTTLSSAPADPQVMVVSTPATVALVRSETFSPGWSARLTPIGGGPSRVLGVGRFGLVQRITVPKGNWRITWRYAPRGLTAGLVASIVGLVVLVVGLVLVRWRPRRRRAKDAAAVATAATLDDSLSPDASSPVLQ